MKSDLCPGSLFRFGIKPICITYTDTDRILIVFTKQIKSEKKKQGPFTSVFNLAIPPAVPVERSIEYGKYILPLAL